MNITRGRDLAQGAVVVICPACYSQITVSAGVLRRDPDGELCADPWPVLMAVSMHMRYGCVRRE